MSDTRPTDSVATLVAARKTGDRDLERAMRYWLLADHGVKLVFVGERRKESEAAHAE